MTVLIPLQTKCVRDSAVPAVVSLLLFLPQGFPATTVPYALLDKAGEVL